MAEKIQELQKGITFSGRFQLEEFNPYVSPKTGKATNYVTLNGLNGAVQFEDLQAVFQSVPKFTLFDATVSMIGRKFGNKVSYTLINVTMSAVK